MKNTLPLSLILFLLVCCKKSSDSNKNNNNNVNNPFPDQPISYTEEIRYSPDSLISLIMYSLTYDGNGRVTKILGNSSPEIKFDIKYESDKYITDVYRGTQLVSHEIFWLGPLSLVDSTYQELFIGSTFTEKYIYNIDSQLVQKKEYNYTTATGSTLANTTNYEYNNSGNVILETDDFSTTDYVYTDFPNTINLGRIYLSAPKNLPLSTKYTSGGSIISYTVYSYGFDDKNRIIKDTASLPYDIRYRTYTYK